MLPIKNCKLQIEIFRDNFLLIKSYKLLINIFGRRIFHGRSQYLLSWV